MEDAQKEQLRRKEIGFVFQAVALIPIMNAYENVDFAMRLAEPELTAKEVDERIRETLALVGMEERMRHHRLPSGRVPLLPPADSYPANASLTALCNSFSSSISSLSSTSLFRT